MTVETRLSKLEKSLPQGVDAAILTSEYSRKYFLGMASSAGTVVVTREKSYFIIDFRYIEVAKNTVTDAEVVLQGRLYKDIADILKAHKAKNIAVESDYITLSEYTLLKEQLPEFNILGDDRVCRIITNMRVKKEPNELECIKKAQQITDDAFTYICGFIKEGMTEKEVALELEYYMFRHGAEALSFETICVSGTNSSKPHGVPGDKKIEKGDFVTMDFGCMVGGYCSDMTRTVAIGYATDEMKKVYETVRLAQSEAMKAAHIGAKTADIDKVARDIINNAGYEGCFGHGLGHAVGLEIHENPRFSPSDKGECTEGLVITVEPGIYIPGKFGVRIENMIYFDKDEVINLTKSDRSLIIL